MEKPKRNFDMFHRSSLFVPPNPEVLKMAMDAHENGYPLIITTARNEFYRSVTELWLDKHNVPFENLFMREDGDNRPDYVVKIEMLKNKILPYYGVARFVDDNDQAVQAWKDNGYAVTVVPGWGENIPEDVVLQIDNVFSRGGCIRCGRTLKNGGTIGPDCARMS